ncbi:MAG: hypothetical protein WC748_04565 [Legionellales bacterium]|jgi:hypothetical protein
MYKFLVIFVLIFCHFSAFALSCKQTESIPLALTHERTTLLSSQFASIQHIEVLPQKVIPSKTGFIVDSVQILMCGEIKPETPTATNTPGQTCQFDSNCLQPMRCQNNVCVLPE